MLMVRLAPERVKALEDFTRAHLGGEVATMVDGNIVTMQTVRSVISDGQAHISRCFGNACEVLRVKLAK
jgi:preprotein translocase subunit SecD